VTDRPLTVSTDQHPDGPTVLTVGGELDQHTATELREAIDEIPLASGVVVDLTELTYCDSTGISVLVSAVRRAQHENGSLSLVGLNADLLHHFRIVGLGDVFEFHSTVDEAVRSARP
jgi:anti-sigma B factor antagonist